MKWIKRQASNHHRPQQQRNQRIKQANSTWRKSRREVCVCEWCEKGNTHTERTRIRLHSTTQYTERLNEEMMKNAGRNETKTGQNKKNWKKFHMIFFGFWLLLDFGWCCKSFVWFVSCSKSIESERREKKVRRARLYGAFCSPRLGFSQYQQTVDTMQASNGKTTESSYSAQHNTIHSVCVCSCVCWSSWNASPNNLLASLFWYLFSSFGFFVQRNTQWDDSVEISVVIFDDSPFQFIPIAKLIVFHWIFIEMYNFQESLWAASRASQSRVFRIFFAQQTEWIFIYWNRITNEKKKVFSSLTIRTKNHLNSMETRAWKLFFFDVCTNYSRWHKTHTIFSFPLLR